MKRKHVPQISMQSWYPEILRNCMYEFMTWFVHKTKAAKPFMPVVEEGLQQADNIIVLDKPAGAGFETLAPFLNPDIPLQKVPIQNFTAENPGLYVSVNNFHHLSVKEAGSVLEKISAKGHPVVILEGNNDSLWQVFGMLVLVPLSVILTAPFVRPFRWSRLLFSWVIPILPLITCVDGFLALFKLYAPADLDELVSQISTQNYSWRSGKMDNGRGGKIIYLIGKKTA